MRPLGGCYPFKTQNGPLGCGNDLRTETTGFGYWQSILEFISHECSAATQCSGHDQATVTDVEIPPRRDFVNALACPQIRLRRLGQSRFS